MPAQAPSINDRDFDLFKKICNNTALLADTEAGDVASIVAGSGISVSNPTGVVTISNSGVLSITGTDGNVLANGLTTAQTGAVVLTLPTAITGVNSVASVAGSDLVLKTGTSGTALTFTSASSLGTFVGDITVGTTRPVRLLGSNGTATITASAGGWNIGYLFKGSAGTAKGGFWAAGNTDALTNFFIGDGAGTAWVGFTSSTATFTCDVLPAASATYDLGVTGTRWRNIFGTALTVTNAISAGNITSTGVFLAANGSAAAPSYSFTTDTTKGIYADAANVVRVAINGARVASFTTTGLQLLAGNTTAGGPSLSIDAAGTTGLFTTGVGNLSLAAAGTLTASFSSTAGIALTALGTNQSITLTPSGTGAVTIGTGVMNSTGAFTFTGGAGDSTWIAGTGASRIHTFQITTSGSSIGTRMVINDGNTQIRNNLLLGGLTTDGGVGYLQLPVGTTATTGITLGTKNIYEQSTSKLSIGGTGSTLNFDGLNSATPSIQNNNSGANISLANAGGIIITANGAAATLSFASGLGVGGFTMAADQGIVFNPSAPASIGTTPGTAASTHLISAATGGTTSIATTGIGGTGSKITFQTGTGGVASSATTASTGGAGGDYTLSSGIGGGASVIGSGTGTGGRGGNSTTTTGAGGAASTSTGVNLGGAGGAWSVTTGNGGAGANGSTNTGGAGGAISFTTGNGGAGATAAGNSGAITLLTGTSGTGGVVGQIILGTGGITSLTVQVNQNILVANDLTASNLITGSGTGISISTTAIVGGAANMTITAGTGNSRTLALRSTTAGGAAATFLTGDANQTTVLSGALKLANAYVVGVQVPTGYITIQDSTGTTYKVSVNL